MGEDMRNEMVGPAGSDIVLVTLNARWHHASFGLRSLRANLGNLADRCRIVERTITDRAVDVVEEILAMQPRVVGIGVYVWNATLSLEIVRLLKRLRASVVVVVGGPEVSHEVAAQEICARADYVVTGEGELAFRALCERLLDPARRSPLAIVEKVIEGGRPALDQLAFPYHLYDDTDLQHRVVYVEASRGCPFTCEFCLSSLDDGVRTFDLEAFLAEMDALLSRGLLRFKFVDRTFNLKIESSRRILAFFRERLRPGLFLHFEMVPDRLPEPLRAELASFPAGVVQLEVGIQTFDDDVARRIARRQDGSRIEDNLRYLAAHTGVHVHADLIVGLPGEDLATFGRGFDRLWSLGANEIQVGILKRLRGAPIIRHDEESAMIYSESPPYDVLCTAALSFEDAQRMKRFARYFDLVVNNGRFPATSRVLLGQAGGAFASFLAFSDWLWSTTKTKEGIAPGRLSELLHRFLAHRGVDDQIVLSALERDLGRDRVADLPERQARHAAAPR